MVDEAHGIGVLGANYSGKGVCDHFGLLDEVDLIMGHSVNPRFYRRIYCR